MVPKTLGWYPKWWCGHFLNLKNHENWSSYKVCQGVGVPLGYHFGYYLGTIRHFGYHWGTILGTIMSNFCVVKNRFFEIFHIYRYTLGTIGVPLWVPFGTQSVLINVESSKNRFFTTQKFNIILPKMIPQWHSKCIVVPK